MRPSPPPRSASRASTESNKHVPAFNGHSFIEISQQQGLCKFDCSDLDSESYETDDCKISECSFPNAPSPPTDGMLWSGRESSNSVSIAPRNYVWAASKDDPSRSSLGTRKGETSKHTSGQYQQGEGTVRTSRSSGKPTPPRKSVVCDDSIETYHNSNSVRDFTASSNPPLDHYHTANLKIVFSLDISELGDLESFRRDLKADIAAAARLREDQVHIHDIFAESFSTVTCISLRTDGPGAQRRATQLVAALADPRSALRRGRRTRTASDILLLPDQAPLLLLHDTADGGDDCLRDADASPLEVTDVANSYLRGECSAAPTPGRSAAFDYGRANGPGVSELLPREGPADDSDASSRGGGGGGGGAESGELQEMQRAICALVRAMSDQNDDLKRLSAVQTTVDSIYGGGDRLRVAATADSWCRPGGVEVLDLGLEWDKPARPAQPRHDALGSDPGALDPNRGASAWAAHSAGLGPEVGWTGAGRSSQAERRRIMQEAPLDDSDWITPSRTGKSAAVDSIYGNGARSSASDKGRPAGRAAAYPTVPRPPDDWDGAGEEWGHAAGTGSGHGDSHRAGDHGRSGRSGGGRASRGGAEERERIGMGASCAMEDSERRVPPGRSALDSRPTARGRGSSVAVPVQEDVWNRDHYGGDLSRTLTEHSFHEQAALLVARPVKERERFLLTMPVEDIVSVLCMLPLNEVCLTLRHLSTPHVKLVVENMRPEVREPVIMSMSSRELEGLLNGMSAASISDLLDGMGSGCIVHIFKGVHVHLQAAVLDVLRDTDRCTVLSELMPRDRCNLLSILPSRTCASIMRLLRSKLLVSVYQGMPLERFLSALEEMMPNDQKQILDFLPRKERHDALAKMSRPMAAMICTEMSPSDRMAVFQGMDSVDASLILTEMSYPDAVDVLSALNNSERAAILSEMNERSRVVISMTMTPEVLAPAVLLMSLEDRRFFMTILEPRERAAVLDAMSASDRTLVWKDILTGDSGETKRGELTETLQYMDPEKIASALSEISVDDRVQYLLLMSAKGRSGVLQLMDPREISETLDLFLLEDRANTVRCMNVQNVSFVLQEMPTHKKALLLASIGQKERGAILATMSPHDLSNLLSILPLADCVDTLKVMGPKLASTALLEMSVEESSLTLEAVPPRERASIILAMQPDDAAAMLDQLQQEVCAATLKYFGSEAVVRIMSELPVPSRARMILYVALKTRAKALAEMDHLDRAALLNAMQAADVLNTMKEMSIKDIESCFGALDSSKRILVLQVVPLRESSRIFWAMILDEQAELFGQIPEELIERLVKNVSPTAISLLLKCLPDTQKDRLLSLLPDKVRQEMSDHFPSKASLIPPDPDHNKCPSDSNISRKQQQGSSPVGTASRKSLLMPESQQRSFGSKGQCITGNAGVSSTFKPKTVQAAQSDSNMSASSRGSPIQNPNKMVKSSAVQTAPSLPVVQDAPSLPVSEDPVIISLSSRVNAASYSNVFVRARWGEQMCGDIAAAVGCSVKRLVIDQLRHNPENFLDSSSMPVDKLDWVAVLFDLKILPIDMTTDLNTADVRTAHEIADDILKQGKDPFSRLNRLHHSLISVKFDSRSVSSAISAQPLQNSSLHPVTAKLERCSDQTIPAECCGVGIAFVPTQNGRNLAVMQIAPDCSASPDKSVKVGDILCSIDGRDVTEIPLPLIARAVLGQPGSNVNIGFQSPGTASIKNVQLLRSNALPAANHSRIDLIPSPTPGIGHGWLGQEAFNSPGMQQKHSATSNSSEKSHLTDNATPKLELDSGLSYEDRHHNIWSTIEDLDCAIEKRVDDIKTFTRSIMQLQMEAAEASNRIASGQQDQTHKP